MGELKKKFNEHMPDYLGLGSYAVVGAVLRYLVTFPCGSAFEFIVSPYAIALIVTAIVCGLLSFIYRNKQLSGYWKILFDVARGAITGFGVGWGGVTAWILLYHLCS